MGPKLEVTMRMTLSVNARTSRIASIASLRRNVARLASHQFREIWVSMEPDGNPVRVVGNDLIQTLEHDVVYTSASRLKTNLAAMHGNTIVARRAHTSTHFCHACARDTGFSSRNPMYDESDTLCGLAGRCGREQVRVISYRLSHGQEDEFPASWALPKSVAEGRPSDRSPMGVAAARRRAARQRRRGDLVHHLPRDSPDHSL
jgi:hypothetical protein